MMKMKMIIIIIVLCLVMEHRWKEIDRGKPKYSEKNLSQCNFVRHKSHIPRDRNPVSAVRDQWLTA
jgi:hypothetical protein